MPKAKSSRDKPRFVPYAKGFRLPSTRQKELAIGNWEGMAHLLAVPEFFANIPRCTSADDWLAQYSEQGQTYDCFLRDCPWLSRRKVKYIQQDFNPDGTTLLQKYPRGAIYVIPLGTFERESSPDFDTLVEYAELFFKVPVKKLPAMDLVFENQDIFLVEEEPVNGTTHLRYEKLKSRFNDKAKHRQLSVDAALAKLRSIMPDDGICMLALTMCDLYADGTDLFVAGMAQGRYHVAIFSLHRYDPNMTFSAEFWHTIIMTNEYEQEERQRLILQRACRLLVHEISHLLGIDHCIFFSCCMNGSGHLSEDFCQPMYLCPVDLHKLHRLCGFNVARRYSGLERFFRKYKLYDEAKWMRKRLKYLGSEAERSLLSPSPLESTSDK